MYVRIMRDRGGRLKLTLEEPDDCSRFHLRAEGIGPTDAEEALARDQIGSLAGDDAFISQDVLRKLAKGRTGPKWDERFEAMVGYARSKGWVSESGHLQAHCDWA